MNSGQKYRKSTEIKLPGNSCFSNDKLELGLPDTRGQVITHPFLLKLYPETPGSSIVNYKLLLLIKGDSKEKNSLR